jgi:hypothetical protein
VPDHAERVIGPAVASCPVQQPADQLLLRRGRVPFPAPGADTMITRTMTTAPPLFRGSAQALPVQYRLPPGQAPGVQLSSPATAGMFLPGTDQAGAGHGQD